MLGLYLVALVAGEPRAVSLAAMYKVPAKAESLDDPARMREEMAQERRLLNAKISEVDKAKVQVQQLSTALQQTKQELSTARAKDAAQLQELSAKLQADKLTAVKAAQSETVKAERAQATTQVQRLQQLLTVENQTAARDEQTLQARVGKDEAAMVVSERSNEARLHNIRDALKDALAVPLTAASPFTHDEAKEPKKPLTLSQGQAGNTTLTVEDTVDRMQQQQSKSMQHQDRVMNWAFRKLASEEKQMHALNVSKAATEERMDVLERELNVSLAETIEVQQKLDASTDALKSTKVAGAVAATEAKAMLVAAESRVQKIHDLAAKADTAAAA